VIRPLHDWVLVKMDPLPVQHGAILLIQDNTVNVIRTGTVQKVGPGKKVGNGKRAPVGVEPGEKIAFLRWHLEHKPGQAVQRLLEDLGDDLGLIRGADILYAFLEER
jgi:co-chaperonin GroES (HSP10)